MMSRARCDQAGQVGRSDLHPSSRRVVVLARNERFVDKVLSNPNTESNPCDPTVANWSSTFSGLSRGKAADAFSEVVQERMKSS